MTIFEAIILGLTQGLTEFLPISSSGHLVVLQDLMGVVDPSIFFEVWLHFATLLAILVFFRQRLLRLSWRDLGLLALASVPAAAVGLLLRSQLVAVFNSLTMVGLMLLATGVVNYLIDRQLEAKPAVEPVNNQDQPVADTARQAFKIGLYQMFALVPGISRSGITVFAGLNQNLNRLRTFEFSFLMAVPVIFGASLYELFKLDTLMLSNFNWPALSLGFVTAFATGLVSLWLLKFVIERAKFEYLAGYCWLLGGGILLLSLFGVV